MQHAGRFFMHCIIFTLQTGNMTEQENASEAELVDLSYVYELADGRKEFVHQLLSIFLENTPPAVTELERLVKETDDWESISKKAHFLKSSLGVVKVQGLHERLQEIETISRDRPDRQVIEQLLEEVLDRFQKAEPVIRAEFRLADG